MSITFCQSHFDNHILTITILDTSFFSKYTHFCLLSIPDVGNAIGVSPVSSEQKAIQKRVETVLQTQLNANVEVVRFEEFQEIWNMWMSYLALNGAQPFTEIMGLPSGTFIAVTTFMLKMNC